MTLVGASWLSKLCLVARHVEDVVDDLEHDAELCREAPERHCRRSVEALERKHRADRGGDQRAGLELVEMAEGDRGLAGTARSRGDRGLAGTARSRIRLGMR